MRRHRLRKEEWIGGLFSMPLYVAEKEPYRPDLSVWFDLTNELIVGHALFRPPTSLQKVVEHLVKTFRKPLAGPPRRPSRIRVEDETLAALIREQFDNVIEVCVGPIPELKQIVDQISQMPPPADESPSYFHNDRITPEIIEVFFQAAARLYRLAPWEYVSDSFLLRLDIPSMDIQDACLSIIGADGQSYGFLFFESIDDFLKMAERSEAILSGEHSDIGIPIFSVNFDRGSDIPKSMRREIAKYGYEVADRKAFPSVLRLDPDGIPMPLKVADYLLGAACSEAITRFFTRHGDEFVGEVLPEASVSGRYVLKELPGRPIVKITAPHPEALWVYEAADDEEDLEEEIQWAREMVRDFLSNQKETGRNREWLEQAEFVCDSLYDFKIYYADGIATGWTASLIEDFLMDYFPRKISTDDQTIENTPDIIEAFFSWMVETRQLTKSKAEAIRRRVRSKRRRFLREVHDPANFGMAKTLVMEMLAAGVDPMNQSEVDDFIEKYNEKIRGSAEVDERLTLGGSGSSKDAKSRSLKERAGKKRWVWSGEGPPPDTKAPCPCGSGRRYKRCCMPR